jgi:transposase-like protein
MARVLDRERAIQLRQQGNTYSEIKRQLGIGKSTLSDWLSKYPLTQKQFQDLQTRIKNNKEIAIEKFRETSRLKRERRLKYAYETEKNRLLSLSLKELEIAGLFLYWGEGAKRINGYIGINNTDPKVVQFSLYWLIKILKIPKEKIRVSLHLYKDMDIYKEIDYWSTELNIPKGQFRKPYIKTSNRTGLTHKGFGHGTCGLVANNVLLKEKLMMSIEAIADYYCSKIPLLV